jgi:4-hydroxybenzoate polyprenyltransferase
MSSPEHALSPGQPLRATLNGWLTSARISNSPTVVTDVLAGAALAGVGTPGAAVVLLSAALVLFYTAGMFLNDVCDFAWDLRHRPDRPLPTGVVARSSALAAVVVLFGVGSALLWAVGPAAFASGLVLIALIAIYDRWHKNNPLSPLVMAGCRLMVYVTAFVAFTWPPSPALVVAGGLLVAYLVGLTAIAKSETRPTVVGYWPAALLFLPPLYFATRLGVGPALVLPLLVAVWVVYCLTFVYRARTRSIGAAIGRLIAGISLVDGLVLASAGAFESVWLAVAGFGLTLFFQRYVEGT